MLGRSLRAVIGRPLPTTRASSAASSSSFSSYTVQRSNLLSRRGGGAASGPASRWHPTIYQSIRGLKYHEAGWWEDDPDGGVKMGQPEVRDREAYRSVLAYVSDARKEEIYRLHKLDPEIYDAQVLSYLFTLSRIRIDAIIRLKAEEVQQRLKGRLFTEDDDTHEHAKKDPTELLLLDEENAAETMEDLSKPPGWEPQEKEMLTLQAALQELKLLQQIKEDGSSIPPGSLEGLSKGIDDAKLDEILKALENRSAQIRSDTDEAMRQDDLNKYKPLAEAPAPMNGFKFLDNLERSILKDPYFLYYHTFMGLEKQRLELCLLKQKANVDKKISPYDKAELEIAIQEYGRRKQRSLELFARLIPLHNLAAEEKDEAKLAGYVKEEKALIKEVRNELGTRIVEMEEVEEAVKNLGEVIQKERAKERRPILVKGLKADNESMQKEKLSRYMELLHEEAKATVDIGSSSIFQDVKWEALQQHRRLLRGAGGASLYASIGSAEAHVNLEDELIRTIERLTEKEVLASEGRRQTEAGGFEEKQLNNLGQLVAATIGDGRTARLRAYVLSLFDEFSWAEGSPPDAASINAAAIHLFVMDIKNTSLRSAVVPYELAERLKALSPSQEVDLVAGLKAAATQTISQSQPQQQSQGGGQVNQQQGSPVAAWLPTLRTARIDALKGTLSTSIDAASKEKGLRRYLLLVYLSQGLQAFEKYNKILLNKAKSQLNKTFRTRPEALKEAIKMITDRIYASKEIGKEEYARLAGLTGRTETYIESMMKKNVLAELEKIDPLRVDIEGMIGRLLCQDAFEAGIKSGPKLGELRQQLKQALVGISLSDIDMKEGGELIDEVEMGEIQQIFEEVLESPIGLYAGHGDDWEALEASPTAPLEDRVRAAKALLDFLREDEDYKAYAAKLQDEIVDEIEEELLDTVYDVSDEIRTEIDPALVDLKPKQHYDIPSLRFRVLNDSEPAVSRGILDGYVEEEGEKEIEVWHPKEVIRDLRPMSAAVKNESKKASGKPQLKRWNFAFKDSSIEGAGGEGAAKGGTVVRDRTTGRLRTATPQEEKARSWIKRASG